MRGLITGFFVAVMFASPARADTTIIGKWRDDRKYVAADITLQRDGGQLMLVQKFDDGGVLRREMKEQKVRGGRRYDFIEGSNTGDHFIYHSEGTLESRDELGTIHTSMPMR